MPKTVEDILKEEWSFSRRSTFDECQLGFKLSYLDGEPNLPNFWSDSGTLLHECAEGILKGDKTRDDASWEFYQGLNSCTPIPWFLQESYWKIKDKVHNWLLYFKMPKQVLGVEPKFQIEIDGIRVRGFIDLATYKSGVIVNDWKISGKFKKADIQKKRRQLYIYGAATKELYGELPKKLVFTFPKESYSNRYHIFDWNTKDYNEARDWFKKGVDEIANTKEFKHKKKVDFFCEHLCGVRNSCPLFQEYLKKKKK